MIDDLIIDWSMASMDHRINIESSIHGLPDRFIDCCSHIDAIINDAINAPLVR